MSTLSDIAQEEIKMEMTPMIDVTFLLLIFFLCTLKFKLLEGKLSAYLPKDVGVNSAPAEPKEKVEITIHVKTAGRRFFAADPDMGQPWDGSPERRFVFDGRQLTLQLGPRKTSKVDELGGWLKDHFDKDPEASTTIDCRPGTVYGDMVPVLDALVDAGFESVTFVGEYKNAKK
jgi:biopolymer transport protein ExbD